MTTMMACGHSANAVHDGEPACAICAPKPEAYTVTDDPDLTGRVARCGCGTTQPSSTALAFFEYRGPGSRDAQKSCKHCRYFEVAHKPGKSRFVCDHFETDPEGRDDTFYCGCRGWN